MSSQPRPTGVGATLTGGIQDVSAILPLIGTEQCEKHIGSALTGGYLYAAAAPLSIFGSLGIVKAGMSILISSISISIPKFSITFRDFKPFFGYHQQPIWFGARFLSNAGFDLPGTVAPLMGMDGQRFKAETRIVEILEEKKFDDPENLSVRWKSRQWNLMLVVSSIAAALIGVLPYITLLLGPSSWRPGTPLPWLFPVLRTGGSCLVAVCSQFIIQSRVISLMKNRILFMAIYKRFIRGVSKDHKDGLDRWLRDTLKWDAGLPVEQCLWNLGEFFTSGGSFTRPGVAPHDTGDHISLPMETFSPARPAPLFDEHFSFTHLDFRRMRQQHFPSPIRDLALSFLLRIALILSLPATVAGYVGCFTSVNSTPLGGNGPLIWLVLEGALTLLRIVVWASNPKFDEDTAIEVCLSFTQDAYEPLVTTQDQTAFIYDRELDSSKTWVLLPESEFIDHITPYTGPLDHFEKHQNIALYFTLTSDHGEDLSNSFERKDEKLEKSKGVSQKKAESLSLLLTVVNYNMQLGVTLVLSVGSFYYFDVNVKLDAISGRMQANLQSLGRKFHRWRTEDDILFDSLKNYYLYIVGAFGRRKSTAVFAWNWNFSPKSLQTFDTGTVQGLPALTDHNFSYMNQGYEHDLKSMLIETWSRWIIMDMHEMWTDGALCCFAWLQNVSEPSSEGTWEIIEHSYLLAWEWARRELVLVNLSLQLEKILQVRMETCISMVSSDRKDIRLKAQMSSEFEIGQRKRMEISRRTATERTNKAKNDAMEKIAFKVEWPSGEQKEFELLWEMFIEFIDRQWLVAINGNSSGGNQQVEATCLHHDFNLAPLIGFSRYYQSCEDQDRSLFVDQMKNRFLYWHPQYEYEKHEMLATIENIRILDSPTKQELDRAYEFPEPDQQATLRFAALSESTSKGKACSATVYDAQNSDQETVCDVIKKSATHSVVNVHPDIIPSIPQSEHLLFLGCSGGEEPDIAFIQQNRDRWWKKQQNTNTSIAYFTPQECGTSLCRGEGIIAHIFLFLTTTTYVRVYLRHWGSGDVVIQQNAKELGRISGLPEEFKYQGVVSREFGLGEHDLVVVAPERSDDGSSNYYLMGIVVEFFNNSTTVDLTPKKLKLEDDGGDARAVIDDDVTQSDVREEPSRPPSEHGSGSKPVLGLIPYRRFAFP